MSEGIISRRGGGGTGATLVVTGIAGHAVTASKDGKTYTRTFDSSGKATFKGLATGAWTITMTGGGQTATRTVDITADYAVIIAYFAATINVTYPAGSACTCTDGATTLTAPDTSGAWVCVVPNAGTWTVSCTDGTDTASKQVEITADGQSESVELTYRLYLFDNGVVTGVAWDKVKKDQWNYGEYTIDDTIELYGGAYPGDVYYVTLGIGTAIDLSGFSTLKAHLVKDEGEAIARIYVGTAAISNNVVNQLIATGSSGETIAVDISALTDSYFISLYASGSTGAAGTKTRRVAYDTVWLE